jgi:hypothetical protein
MFEETDSLFYKRRNDFKNAKFLIVKTAIYWKLESTPITKGRTIRKVKGGVGQNQKKNLFPAKN